MTDFPFDPGMAGPLATAIAIVVATVVSEDLTCIGVGLLIAAGRVGWGPGLGGCLVGVVLGDLGVWLLGRGAGAGLLRRAWVRRLLPDDRLAGLSGGLCSRAGRAVVVSRCLPGTRVPLYFAAGLVSGCPYRFLGWMVAAAAVWVPLVVGAVAVSGSRVAGGTWVALPVLGAAGYAAVRQAPRLLTATGRARLAAAVARLWRWEFWPAWVFYLPLVPWFLVLAVRHRSLTVWTAANPGITPAGGVVGESKSDILARLTAEWTVPTLLIPTGELADRLHVIAEAGWEYPLVLKPDAGQRGAGVRKCHDATDAEKYLRANPGPVIAQPFHPGPFEAGVFYVRHPNEERGRIFSVTDKVFPAVVGDGHSTLDELIWAHPRYRMQAGTFLARHAGDRVPAAGERFPLALAGNHCQGTLFRDGGHLVTPELERTIDGIARSFDGFHFGRFDVRYTDPAAFRAGRGFAVVELNGVTSESTNLYDPAWPLWRAYHTLFRQWAVLFRIGAANRRRGHRPVSPVGLFALVRSHYRGRVVCPLAD